MNNMNNMNNIKVKEKEIEKGNLTWLDKQKQKIKIFVKKNNIELILIFSIILIINLINTFTNDKLKPMQYGGKTTADQIKQLAISQAASQGPNPQEQMIKAQVTITVLTKIFNYLMSNKIFNSLLCSFGALIKSILTFGGIVIAISMLPILPLFAFMFAIFIILRQKVATFKSL